MYGINDGQKHFCSVQKQASGSFLPALPIGANCCERINRSIKKFIQISKKDPLTQEFFRSTTGFLNERKRHARSRYTHIIHPFSDFAFYREIVMSFTLLGTFISAPFITTFMFHGISEYRWITAMEVISSMIFISDIFVKCYMAIENKRTKEVILNQDIIINKYMLSMGFPLDIITAPSLYVLYIFIDMEKYFYLTYFRLLIIFKLVTFFKYWRHISQRFNLIPEVVDGVKFLVYTFLLVHWSTCITFYVPLLEAGPSHEFTDTVIHGTLLGSNNWLELYIKSVFTAVGLLFCARTGWDNESPLSEIWIILITSIVGKIYMLVLSVAYLNQVLNRWFLETKYLEIMNQLSEFMRYKKLPIALRQRMVHYFEYKFQQKYFRENLISSFLSDKLKREISIHLCQKIVQQASFLADLPTKTLGDLLAHLKSEVFLANDIIIRAGAPADCMYFLSSGTVLVTTPSGKEVCHLNDGAYFGEIALLSKETKRTANVIALEICETYRLDKKIFKSCLRRNPDCLKMIQMVAELRHQRTMALEETFKEELFHKTYIGDTAETRKSRAFSASHKAQSFA